MNGIEATKFLKALKRHLRGKKILLFWDGLPAHRSKSVQAYIKSQHSWLRVERFPGYAPELNPVEYFWACMKKKHLGNLRADFSALGKAVARCKRTLRNDEKLLRGFLKASGLY
jgi:transposase